MKYLCIFFFLILLFTPNQGSLCTFVGIGSVFNSAALSNALNWLTCVPTSTDDVLVSVAATFNITSSLTWKSLSTSLTIGNAFTIDLANNAVFTLSNFTQTAGTPLNINVNIGSSLFISEYINLNTNASFNNQGSISLNLMGNVEIPDGTLKVSGNNILITGSKPQRINGNFYLPPGFEFSTSVAHVFLGSGLFFFNNNNPTISPNGWSFDISIAFIGGATFNGNISRVNTGIPRIINFLGGAATYYISGVISFDANPSYGSTGAINFITISSSSSLTYTNKDINNFVSNITGNATIIHNNPTSNSANTITSTQTGIVLNIENPNFHISGRYSILSQITINFAGARLIDGIFVLNSNLKLNYLSNVTLSAQTNYTGGGKILFTNGLTSNVASLDFYANGIDTSFSGSTFNLFGTSIKFGNMTLNGCAMNSQSQFSVATSDTSNTYITVTANSSFPLQSLVDFLSNSLTFQSTSTSISLTLTGDYIVPFLTSWESKNINIIISGNFGLSQSSRIFSTDSTGLFTLSGNQFTIGSGGSLDTVNLVFPTGNVNIVTYGDRVDLSGSFFLKNTFLSGNASILYSPKNGVQPIINLLKSGFSGIALPSLVVNGNLDLVYSFDGIGQNTGAQLQLETSGSFNGNLTGSSNLTVTFQDSSLSLKGTSINANGGAFVFAGASITTEQAVAVSGEIYLNNTSSFRFQLNSTGSFDLSAVSKLFTVGLINYPTQTNDAPVKLPNNLYIGLLGSTTLGSSFTQINGSLTIDDLDNNSTTAAFSLTLNGNQEQNGQWTLGGNLKINGDLEVSTNNGLNAPGSLTLNSTNINLNANSAIWNISVSFINGYTVLNSNGGPLSLTINDPPESYPEHGVIFAGIFTSNTDTSLIITGPFKPLTVTITNGGLNGTSVSLNNCNVNSGASVFVNPTSLSCSNVHFNGVNFDLIATNTVVFNGNNSIAANSSLNNIQVAASSKLSLTGRRTTTGNIDLLAGSSSFYASDGVVTSGNVNPGSGSFWIDGTNLTCNTFNLTASTSFQYTLTPANIPIYVTSSANYDGNAYIFVNYTWNGGNITIIQSPAHTGLGAFANITVNLFNYAIHDGLNLNSLFIFADIQSTTPPSTVPSTLTPNTLTPSTLTPSTPTPSTLTPSTLTPSTLTPSTLTPSTLTPSTLTPSTLTPNTLTPSTLTPSTLTPNTLTPSTLIPSTFTPSTLTPNTLTPTTNPTSNPVTLSPTKTPSGSWNGTYTVSGNCQRNSSCCCFIGTTAIPVTIVQTSSAITIFGSLTGSCTGNFQVNTIISNLNDGTFVFNNQTYLVSKLGKSITVTNDASTLCNFNLNCLSGLCNSSNLLYISYFMYIVILLFSF